MRNTIELELNIPIIAIKNNEMRTFINTVQKSAKLRAFEKNAHMLLTRQYKGQIITKCSCIEINLFFPRNNRTDCDNKIDGIMDALQRAKIIIDDRYQVVPKIIVTGEYRKNEPGAKITIYDAVFASEE